MTAKPPAIGLPAPKSAPTRAQLLHEMREHLLKIRNLVEGSAQLLLGPVRPPAGWSSIEEYLHSLLTTLDSDVKAGWALIAHLNGLPKGDVGDAVRFTAIATCRVCGCTEEAFDQCVQKTGEPCYWVERDLCSACLPAGERRAES